MAVELGQQWAASVGAQLQEWAVGTSPGAAEPDAGGALGQLGKFLHSVPPGYPEATSPEEAARDWLLMSVLAGGVGGRSEVRASRSGASGQFEVVASPGGAGSDFRLRRVGASLLELSSLVPALESFGLAVVEAVPWRFGGLGPGGSSLYVDDIGLRVVTSVLGPAFYARGAEARLVRALQAVLAGEAEETPLNRLVVGAGLDWREVNLLGTYLAYRRTAGGPRAKERLAAMVEGLVEYPQVAATIVRLFHVLLCSPDPNSAGSPGEAFGPAEAEARSALGQVPDLAHFEALQELLSMVLATTRSNWSLGRDEVALKFASTSLEFLPRPKPFAEVFVWSPGFEGIHLRFGPVARGGIRWSDRHDELRTEVLDLARAQVKKNSLIIPTGAKGGFSLHRANGPAENGLSAEDEGREAYRRFVTALLEVTDNVVGGEVRRPEGVVCRDGADPYLVVAPDKGTANFSDLANSISAERGYWLGDAFASGGSNGYDHKALGITAKGTWLAVRRHFRALGMDAQRDPLRVVGVGDMSGDVFGNGMLQSPALRLVAAFDHRHVFVDPAPDAEASFAQRVRLSGLPHSSWADYDLSAASPGAGIYSRQDKVVELAPEAAVALGTRPGPLTPPEVAKVVLKAPVDLVYFGGVGTFVKASDESDVEVDDAANDEIRIASADLRARVVAEGANLAMTQRARAGYARRGGRVNTDFVDNAAGVVMSDREVNSKILLDLAEARGVLPEGQRDKVLAEAEPGAVEAVLATVEQSIVALDRASATSGTELSAYEALGADLAAEDLLDPEVEFLPGPEELARRRSAGAGLSRPELAVVLALARSELARSIGASPLPRDPCLLPLAISYFPPPVGEMVAGLVPSHPLFREIVASQLANEVLARMGGLWAHEVSRENGCPPWRAAAAYWAAREVLGLGDLYLEADELTWSISLDAELQVRAVLTRAVDRLARWYLRRGLPETLGKLIERDRMLVEGVRAWAARAEVAVADEAGGAEAKTTRFGPGALGDGAAEVGALVQLGVPAGLASRAGLALAAAVAGELGDAARATDSGFEVAVEAYELVVEGLGLEQVAEMLAGWHPADRWERWQLHVLSEDLADMRAWAARAALASHPGRPRKDAVFAWLADRREATTSLLGLIGELRKAPAPNLSLASITLRAVRAALEGTATPVGGVPGRPSD